MIRRFGERIVAGQRYILRPGAYGVLSDGDRILLTYQGSPEYEFQLPGGGIDPGENALQAVHRETLEETGYTIFEPRHLGTYRRFVFMEEYDKWAEKVCHIFLARTGLSHGLPREPEHSAHWMTYREAVACLRNEGDRYFLEQALG
jgi:8-oxo-dGTP diphosphatase